LIDTNGRIAIDDHANANSLTVSSNGANVVIDSHGDLDLRHALTLVKGSVELDGGALSARSTAIEADAKLFGHGSVNSPLDNAGTVESKGGVLEIKGDVAGSGALKIDSASTLQLDRADANNVTFLNNAGHSGTLVLKDSFDFTGKVSGFSGHDGIDLKDIDFNDGHITASYSHGTLTVSDGSHSAHIAFDGNFTIASFSFSNDGHNGTFIVDPAPSNVPMVNNGAGPLQSVAFDQNGNESFVFQSGSGHAPGTNFASSGGPTHPFAPDNFANGDFGHLQPLLQATNGGQDPGGNVGHGDNAALVNVPVNGLHASDFIIHHA